MESKETRNTVVVILQRTKHLSRAHLETELLGFLQLGQTDFGLILFAIGTLYL